MRLNRGSLKPYHGRVMTTAQPPFSELSAPASPGSVVLSAGPGAGKTRLLDVWAEAWPDARRLSLAGMEAPGGLRAALSELWPEAASAAADLLARFPALPWGAALGAALGEVLPDARLLLDDVHGAEPLMDELLPFVRHFPDSGTLVLASRHRFPELGRAVTHGLDAEHPVWRTRVEPAHWLSLPEELLGHALALHFLGAQKPDLASQELVRRNVAVAGWDQSHRLHPAWEAAAERCLALPLPLRTWERLGQLLLAHADRTLRTTAEFPLAAVLEHLPAQALATLGDGASTSPVAVPGERRHQYRAYRELGDRHAQAIARGDGPQAQAIATRLIALATRHGFQRDLLGAHVAKFEAQLLLDAALPFGALLDVPAEAFADLTMAKRYQRCFARRAAALGDTALARRLGGGDEALPAPTPGFRLHAFGPFELVAPDGSEVKLHRKAAIALLALLTLHPEGLSTREVAGHLFGVEVSAPVDALYTVTSSLRKALAAVGGDHLFDASGGLYRLRWHAIAACDLHEFEALMRKAADLERRGLSEGSELFRRLARAFVRGEFAANLPELFGAARADLARRTPLEVGS